jgi:hypothetical protein
MSKFCAHIILIELLPTTYGPQKFSKIRVLKVAYFHLHSKKYPKLKNRAIIIFFINNIKTLHQFSEKYFSKNGP